MTWTTHGILTHGRLIVKGKSPVVRKVPANGGFLGLLIGNQHTASKELARDAPGRVLGSRGNGRMMRFWMPVSEKRHGEGGHIFIIHIQSQMSIAKMKKQGDFRLPVGQRS